MLIGFFDSHLRTVYIGRYKRYSDPMYLRIKAIPGSKKEEVKAVKPDQLEIRVREPAERNLANTRILELVARHCGVPVGKVKILSGHQSRSKLLSVDTGLA